MSHFASAADFTSPQTDGTDPRVQRNDSGACQPGIRPPLTHCASTNAIAYARPGAVQSLVRPGTPSMATFLPARGDAPISALRVEAGALVESANCRVKDLPAGARIGYGGSFVATAPDADGRSCGRLRRWYPAPAFEQGQSDRRGSVCADRRHRLDGPDDDRYHRHRRSCVRATKSPCWDGKARLSLDAQQIARTAGTISYNVLCGISARVKRYYVD